MALRSHLLSAVRFADYRTGEVTLADELWNELPDDSLTIMRIATFWWQTI